MRSGYGRNFGSFFPQKKTQTSISSEIHVLGFLGPSGFDYGRRAAVAVHRAANVPGADARQSLDTNIHGVL